MRLSLMHYYLMSIASFKQGHLYLYIAQILSKIHSGRIVLQNQTNFLKVFFASGIEKILLWVQGDPYLSEGEFSSFN